MEHIGDNHETDGRSPERFGIKPRLTTLHQPTQYERKILETGLPRLGEAMREARLSLSGDDAVTRGLQCLQSNVNTPLLVVLAFIVLGIARDEGFSQILASSRDCYLWTRVLHRLQERLAPETRVRYFYTGRIPRSFPSAGYSSYVRRICDGQKTLIVDLCGTGWSLQRLLEQTAVLQTEILLVHKMAGGGIRKVYETLGATTGKIPIRSIMPDSRQYSNLFLELSNPAPHTTVLDVIDIGAAEVPVFADWQEGDRISFLRNIQDAALNLTLPSCSRRW